jgi:hypothetical protein
MPINFQSPYGAPKYVGGSAVAASVATVAALKALDDVADLVHGNEVTVDADGSRWRFHSTSALTGDDILVVTPTATAYASAGRWLRAVGRTTLYLPFTFATADGATLLTVPTGCALKLDSAHWKITTGFTGGSSSAIGVDSSIDTTAGDLLGGSGGDVAATLVAGIVAGTVGTVMDTDAELHSKILPAGATVRLQRITSAFTAGAGAVGLVVDILAHPGA